MKLLLDTHTFIWWQEESNTVPIRVKRLIKNPKNSIYFSVVVAWEIAIKKSLGKLKTPEDVKEAIAENRFLTLPITIDHALAVQHLPHHHKDPFDRLLIAQAKIENLTLVSRDAHFKRYDVETVW